MGTDVGGEGGSGGGERGCKGQRGESKGAGDLTLGVGRSGEGVCEGPVCCGRKAGTGTEEGGSKGGRGVIFNGVSEFQARLMGFGEDLAPLPYLPGDN